MKQYFNAAIITMQYGTMIIEVTNKEVNPNLICFKNVLIQMDIEANTIKVFTQEGDGDTARFKLVAASSNWNLFIKDAL